MKWAHWVYANHQGIVNHMGIIIIIYDQINWWINWLIDCYIVTTNIYWYIYIVNVNPIWLYNIYWLIHIWLINWYVIDWLIYVLIDILIDMVNNEYITNSHYLIRLSREIFTGDLFGKITTKIQNYHRRRYLEKEWIGLY